MFYNGLFNAFSELFDGAPGWCFDWVIPVCIISLFVLVLGSIIFLFIKFNITIVSLFKKNDTIEPLDSEEKPKRKRRKKFY